MDTRRCNSESCKLAALKRSTVLDAPLATILANPVKDWQRLAYGGVRIAKRVIDVDWKKFNQDNFLFSHCSIVCSCRVEDNGYYIDPVCSELVNNNGNAWSNEVLLATFRTFIGADNFLEHVQISELSKGKILDAVIRPVTHKNAVGKADVYWCFAGDAKILMADGSIKEIKDIEPGELVYSGEGKIRKVLANSHRFASNLIRIKVRGVIDPIVCTAEHKIQVKDEIGGEWEWVEASFLKRNQWVFQPSPILAGRKRIDPDLAWLVGMYLAEGSLVEREWLDGSKHFSTTQLTCHRDERDTISRVAESVMASFGGYPVPIFNCRWDKSKKFYRQIPGTVSHQDKEDGNGSNIRIFHSVLSGEMFRLCGRGSTAKRLNNEVVTEWDDDSKKHLIAGWIDGDGCSRRNVVNVKSASNVLLRQMEVLLASLGFAYTTTGKWHDGPYSGCASIELDCYASEKLRPYLRLKGEFDSLPAKVSFNNRASFAVEGGIARRIESTEQAESEVEIPVYNIEVEDDHTYIVNNIKVKNCDILVATDRKHADLIRRITSGELTTLSMGCNANNVTCSKCGIVLTDDDKNCEHLDHELLQYFVDKNGVRRIVAELCGRMIKGKDGKLAGDSKSVQFIEASWVERPAFTGAVLNHYISEVPKLSSIMGFNHARLADCVEDLFKLRVADVQGMTVLRVARAEWIRRQREATIEKVAKSLYWGK